MPPPPPPPPSSPRISALLQPYTKLPNTNSILLLTSTLGASANWLLIRFLCHALASLPAAAAAASKPRHTTAVANHGGILLRDGDGDGDGARSEEQEQEEQKEQEQDKVNVILVSWLRDWAFWKQEARKGGGLDLERLRAAGRFAFVDGLGGLFLADSSSSSSSSSSSTGDAKGKVVVVATTTTTATASIRGPPGRMVPARAPAAAAAAASSASSPQGYYTLRDASLKHLESTVQSALARLATSSSSSSSSSSSPPTRKTLLVFDAPDALLAAANLPPSSFASTLLTLHTQAAHVLVHVSADDALLAPSSPPQPLEINGHDFLVKTAHMSRRVLSCRVLDTGVARDVSGVLRVTERGSRGGGLELVDQGVRVEEEEGGGNKELLYLVKGDGSVKVFERGGD